MSGVEITSAAFTPSSDVEAQHGLLGWIVVIINGALVLDGLTLRRTLDDRLAVSYPARRDRPGRQHPIIRPIDDHARRQLEGQIFAALGITEEATS